MVKSQAVDIVDIIFRSFYEQSCNRVLGCNGKSRAKLPSLFRRPSVTTKFDGMWIIWSQTFVDCSPEPFPLQSVTPIGVQRAICSSGWDAKRVGGVEVVRKSWCATGSRPPHTKHGRSGRNVRPTKSGAVFGGANTKTHPCASSLDGDRKRQSGLPAAEADDRVGVRGLQRTSRLAAVFGPWTGPRPYGIGLEVLVHNLLVLHRCLRQKHNARQIEALTEEEAAEHRTLCKGGGFAPPNGRQ